MKHLLIISLMSLNFCSCKEGWTDEYKNEYLQTCREGNRDWAKDETALNNYCSCTLEHTMQHYGSIEEVVENADSTKLSIEINNCRTAALKQK